MTQKERENFYRIATVIVDHGTESLSAVLDNDLSTTSITFEDFINIHHHELYHLCYNRIPCCQCTGGRLVQANPNRIMYPRQLDVLLDKSGLTMLGHNPNLSTTPQHCCRPAKKYLAIANLDITLLRCLLVNFANNCQTNSTLKQDVEDLVKYRNTLYGHAQEAKCSDSEYAKYKTDVEGVILRIARFCNIENGMRQKLNDASQRPLDGTILKKYQITLLEQSLHENHIEEKIDDLQQQLVVQDAKLNCRIDTIEGKVNEVGYRKTNIIAQTKARLLEHSKDVTYAITEDVKICYEILEKYKILVMFAKAGGGKSKTSLQIAMKYQEYMFTPMIFVNDEITQNRDLINFNDQTIVIVEDLFGRSNINFNEDLHRGILDVLYACIKRESCKSKLIITIRGDDETNRNLIEKHKIFEKDVLINIDTIRQWGCRAKILSNHMKKHDISLCKCKQVNYSPIFNLPPVAIERCIAEVVETNENAIQLCVSLFNDICSGKYEMQIGFPQACHLFCSNKNLTKQGSFYFTHASKSLVNEIMDFKIKGFDNKLVQYQYCVLVYAAMKNSIDVDYIDETCFKNILSYFEDSHTIKMSLLREAVRTLEGTYFTKKSSISDRSQPKRLKFSDVYILQHYTIQEAILVSYGDDVDVLSFCEFGFLLEYIRPKGYKDPLSDHAVFLFIDYQTLTNKLISMLSGDDKMCTDVGFYLQTVALEHRRDEIIQFFFQNIEDVTPKVYACLVNGLTSFGNNSDFVKFHPKICKDVMIHFGLTAFFSFCRPKGCTDNNSNFIEIETNLLINALYSVIAFGKLGENCQEATEDMKDFHLFFTDTEFVNSRCAVGNYIYENLIEKDFLDIVEKLFTCLIKNAQKISVIHAKEFLDGLLNKGKRSSIVSQFKEFFEAFLFKYGSIPTILELCLPSTSTMSSPNIIKVADRFLIGKLCAYLESVCGVKLVLKCAQPAIHRENGAYCVYWDNDYFDMRYICLIAEFCLEHGFRSNNCEFVRTLYDQLVSHKEEKSEDEERINDNSVISLEDGKKEDADDENYANYTKVVDELEEDENILRTGSVKTIYSENTDYPFRKTYSRLHKFLSHSRDYGFTGNITKCKCMAIFRRKFASLLYSITPDQELSDSDDFDEYVG
ncbi:uncharacterized protein [Mytilus edulis]|uniref:uncharacterized protein n=1 Tax=Mytilus edulis TaxID=6550 RepID=UPI0039F0A11C